MNTRLGLFLASATAGMISAVLAGFIGTVWGVTRYDPLTPAMYREALVSGALLGTVPTLVVAGLNVLFCYGAPTRFAQFFVPILTAVLTFALVYFVSVLGEGWVGCN